MRSKHTLGRLRRTAIAIQTSNISNMTPHSIHMNAEQTHNERLDPRADGCLGRENDRSQTEGNRCVEPLQRVHEVGRFDSTAIVDVAYANDLSADFG